MVIGAVIAKHAFMSWMLRTGAFVGTGLVVLEGGKVVYRAVVPKNVQRLLRT